MKNSTRAYLLLIFKGPNSKGICFKQFYMLKSLGKMGFQDLASWKNHKWKKIDILDKSMMYLSCIDVLGLDYYIFGSLVY